MNPSDQHVEKLLPRYMAGDLSSIRRWLVGRHIRKCENCARALAQFDRTSARMTQAIDSGLAQVQVPEELLQRIEQQLAATERPRQRASARRVQIAAATSTVVAILAVVTIVQLMVLNQSDPTRRSGEIVITTAGRTELRGTFEYESAAEWRQSLVGQGTGFAGVPEPFEINDSTDPSNLPDESSVLFSQTGEFMDAARLIELANGEAQQLQTLKLTVVRKEGKIITVEGEYTDVNGRNVLIAMEFDP